MRDVIEKFLLDVDEDIREVMLAKATPPKGSLTTLSEYSQEFQNWEMMPDPIGFIIDWQNLRHENRHREKSA